MADNNTPTPQQVPPLPTPPKQDVWGRDLPLPNPNQQKRDGWYQATKGSGWEDNPKEPVADAIEENTEAVKHLTDENQQIFGDIMAQFNSYVANIKKQNQNFFLKQGKLLATDFRRSVIEGMVEGAEKSGEIGKLEDVNYNLRVVYNNLDKMIAIQSEQVNIAKENQEEDKKDRAKKKTQEASVKEDKKESTLAQLFLGKTGAQRRIDEKEKRDNKRTGGLFGSEGVMSMISSFLFKAVPLVGLAIGLLGPEGVMNLVKVFSPAIIQLSNVVYDKVIMPGITMAGQMLKDMVVTPILDRLGVKADIIDNLVNGDKNAKPGDLNSPYEKDGSFNAFDPKHGINLLKNVAKYLLDLDMKFTTAKSAVAHPVAPKIMNSDEYAQYLKEQDSKTKVTPEVDRNGPVPKPPTKKIWPKWSHHSDSIAPVAPPPVDKHFIGKERDDFVPPTPDNDSSTKNIKMLEAQTNALIKNQNYVNDFISQQKNIQPSVQPSIQAEPAISPDELKKRTDAAFDKINTDAKNTWAAGVNNFFTGLASVFSSDGGLMTPIGKVVEQNQPKNDFQDILASMDRFTKVTDTMKAQSKIDATKSVTPIIVQAPTNINTSSSVSNGTTINSPARTANERSLLGYR